MKIVEYDVVYIYLVQKSVEDGWQPFGSPFMNINNNAAMQAIVKYQGEEEAAAETCKSTTEDEVKDKVPAVVHFDGTARLQTVTENDNPWYYNFLKQWQSKTGVPIPLNTSFNDREPICEIAEHALNCFLNTNIDYLYFRDAKLLISKKG